MKHRIAIFREIRSINSSRSDAIHTFEYSRCLSALAPIPFPLSSPFTRKNLTAPFWIPSSFLLRLASLPRNALAFRPIISSSGATARDLSGRIKAAVKKQESSLTPTLIGQLGLLKRLARHRPLALFSDFFHVLPFVTSTSRMPAVLFRIALFLASRLAPFFTEFYYFFEASTQVIPHSTLSLTILLKT